LENQLKIQITNLKTMNSIHFLKIKYKDGVQSLATLVHGFRYLPLWLDNGNQSSFKVEETKTAGLLHTK